MEFLLRKTLSIVDIETILLEIYFVLGNTPSTLHIRYVHAYTFCTAVRSTYLTSIGIYFERIFAEGSDGRKSNLFRTS